MSLLFIIYDLQSVTSFKRDSEAMRAEREVYLSLEQSTGLCVSVRTALSC